MKGADSPQAGPCCPPRQLRLPQLCRTRWPTCRTRGRLVLTSGKASKIQFQEAFNQAQDVVVAVLQVLAHWHEQGHKALLFTQTQQMLDILEGAVQAGPSALASMPPSAATGACMPPLLLLVPACNPGHRLRSQAVLRRCLHAVCSLFWRLQVNRWNSHADSRPANAFSHIQSLLLQA